MSETLTREQIEDTRLWLQERADNCRRLAATKRGDDRAGWLEDAGYFDTAIKALASLTPEQKERDVDSACDTSGRPTDTTGGGTRCAQCARWRDRALESAAVIAEQYHAMNPNAPDIARDIRALKDRALASGQATPPQDSEIAALVERINGLYAKATPGPWLLDQPAGEVHGFASGVIVCAVAPGKANRIYADPPSGSFPSNDRHLIVALRNAWPLIATALGSGTSPNTVSEPS